MYQPQINRDVLLLHLLAQHIWIASRVARHITRLLDIRKGDQLHIGVRLEYRFEALQGCVDGATEWRSRDQVDLGVARKLFAKLTTLFVAEISEEGVVDDMVGDVEVVNALREISGRIESGNPLVVGVPGRGGRSE